MNDVPAQYNDVAVAVMDFAELCTQDYSLKLDHYQRPFVWGRQKVQQLLADLALFSAQDKQPDYYLGTLLLHRDDVQEAYFVIDGQQRLSSLAVLFHALKESVPSGFDFRYRSPVSAENLRLAQQVVREAQPLAFDISLFSRLRFTVITVAREDLAFTFFDTQNSRGVPLKATDLLKAYHLRAIHGGDSTQVERLQHHCALRWEAVQVAGHQGEEKRRDFAPELFHHYLWRARNWCGQKRIERGDYDGVLATFQDQSVRADAVDSLPLYPGHSNQYASRLCLLDGGDFRFDPTPAAVSASAADLPFSLRQPIHEGVGFFLYAQKYAALLDELLHLPTADDEVNRLRMFYASVVGHNSHYLRELFNLALLMYVDRFGFRRLLEFAERTELVLGALRLEKQYIFKEAPLKFLKEADRNLLDVIAAAYRPDEVMDFLKGELDRSAGYGKAFIGRISAGKGVQGRYLGALQKYCGGPHDRSSDIASYLLPFTLDAK
ncbi:MAG: hypothetical protein JWQ01_3791 [Massilia sp.]|jgi:hypothetical protein|nr:hypothetical protein [Massilia sp.]